MEEPAQGGLLHWGPLGPDALGTLPDQHLLIATMPRACWMQFWCACSSASTPAAAAMLRIISQTNPATTAVSSSAAPGPVSASGKLDDRQDGADDRDQDRDDVRTGASLALGLDGGG